MRRAAMVFASLAMIAATAGLLLLVRPEARKAEPVRLEEAPAPVARKAPARHTPPPAPSPAAVASFDEGAKLVRNAVEARRWTPEDAAAFDDVLSGMTPEQRTEILHALVPAINRGEVKLTYRGAIF